MAAALPVVAGAALGIAWTIYVGFSLRNLVFL
jgi:hypothetical protein